MDIYFSVFILVAMFVGDATLGKLPLNVLLPIMTIVFASQFRANYKQIIFVLMSAFILSIYSFNLGIDYNQYYSLWIISFLVCYLTVTVLNVRLKARADRTLTVMFFVCLFLLLIFGILMIFSNVNGRSVVVFGPNMLYRIVAFLSVVVAGYLFFTNRAILALLASLFCLYLLLLTGSRGGVVTMPILMFAWFHCHVKLLSRKMLIYGVLLCILVMLFAGLVNVDGLRSFNFSAVKLDQNPSYADAYIRLRPYLYFLYEADRFSMIGIEYQTWIDTFHTPGFRYPHSLILELIMFYGVFGILFSFFLGIKVISVITTSLQNAATPTHIFYYSFFASGMGALLSGDMGDNAAYMGIVIAMSVKMLQAQTHVDESNAGSGLLNPRQLSLKDA